MTDLLSSGLGILFLSFPHSGNEFHEDSLPVLHFLYGLKSGVSAMLHSKFTKCGSVRIKQKQAACEIISSSQEEREKHTN